MLSSLDDLELSKVCLFVLGRGAAQKQVPACLRGAEPRGRRPVKGESERRQVGGDSEKARGSASKEPVRAKGSGCTPILENTQGNEDL